MANVLKRPVLPFLLITAFLMAGLVTVTIGAGFAPANAAHSLVTDDEGGSDDNGGRDDGGDDDTDDGDDGQAPVGGVNTGGGGSAVPAGR